GAGVGGFDPTSMTAIQVYDGTQKDAGIPYVKLDSKNEAVNYDINYTVSANQELTVNMEANEFMDHNIYQDMGDMISIVQKAIAANDKVKEIKNMLEQDQYAAYTDQLNEFLEAAQKEADYANNNLQNSYSELLGNVDGYLEDVNLAITKIGCRGDQLSMTKTRMNNQQETVEELQSNNDDVDLSDIIIKYTAAYTAYQSSLTAASKLGQQTLLNYI
ncbi:MAG: flagellar hook-associated protein 3, partial [Lachnospiraceae bacterium]|nr:flagellar hook-associated protein 3 [Lachnospiraceae bacterium]